MIYTMYFPYFHRQKSLPLYRPVYALIARHLRTCIEESVNHKLSIVLCFIISWKFDCFSFVVFYYFQIYRNVFVYKHISNYQPPLKPILIANILFVLQLAMKDKKYCQKCSVWRMIIRGRSILICITHLMHN